MNLPGRPGSAPRTRGAAALVVLAAVVTMGQAPVINAVVEHRAVSNGLAREVQAIAQQGRTVWVGYRVPIARSRDGQLNATE